MTEEQVIERIANALAEQDEYSQIFPWYRSQARIAWKEIRVIARENPSPPIRIRRVPRPPFVFDDSP